LLRAVLVALAALWLLSPNAFADDASPADAPNVIQATVTGYAAGADGGAVGSMTALGTQAHWGTVAADWRLYPPGTRLQIEGFPNDVFVVEDSGGGVRGTVFDIWFPDLPTAAAFGTRTLRVTILGTS
jgi:resuscitation-promoting factor RpfB